MNQRNEKEILIAPAMTALNPCFDWTVHIPSFFHSLFALAPAAKIQISLGPENPGLKVTGRWSVKEVPLTVAAILPSKLTLAVFHSHRRAALRGEPHTSVIPEQLELARGPIVVSEAGVGGTAVETRGDPEPGAGQIVHPGGVTIDQGECLPRT